MLLQDVRNRTLEPDKRIEAFVLGESIAQEEWNLDLIMDIDFRDPSVALLWAIRGFPGPRCGRLVAAIIEQAPDACVRSMLRLCRQRRDPLSLALPALHTLAKDWTRPVLAANARHALESIREKERYARALERVGAVSVMRANQGNLSVADDGALSLELEKLGE